MDDTSARNKEEVATAKRAQLLGLGYVDSSKLKNPPVITDILTIEEMYKNRAVVLARDESNLLFGVSSKTPQHFYKQTGVHFADKKIRFVMISESGYQEMMKLINPPEEVVYQDVAISSDSSSQTLLEVSETINKVLPEDIFDYLIRQTIKLGASDVHLENLRDESIRIRFRVDGVLHDVARLTIDKYRQLMSAIASRGDIASSADSPQTGHISYSVDSKDVNIRIETIMSVYGQDVVLRVFTIQKELLDLEKLGLDEQEMRTIESIIEHPSGLVLNVGPTGSGKTTTLYSIINKLNHNDRKVITLEDPVEYSLDGLIQIPVKTMREQSFADNLRAILRMDPDIIMIGEIRDADTANTALQAALTGHLVLSTFHADDTTSALARLLTFTKGNPLFTSALRMVIAQRLVRRLDDDTKKAYQAEKHIEEEIIRILGRERVGNEPLTLHKAVPSVESPFGYKGRTAIVEILVMNEETERIIHDSGKDLLSEDVLRAAKKHGMKTLLEDGIEKVLKGQTTIDEIYRVL